MLRPTWILLFKINLQLVLVGWQILLLCYCSDDAMHVDSPVLAVELDVEDMVSEKWYWQLVARIDHCWYIIIKPVEFDFHFKAIQDIRFHYNDVSSISNCIVFQRRIVVPPLVRPLYTSIEDNLFSFVLVYIFFYKTGNGTKKSARCFCNPGLLVWVTWCYFLYIPQGVRGPIMWDAPFMALFMFRLGMLHLYLV